MLSKHVLAVCFTLVAGSASAQDCFLFFCPPRPMERLEPLEPAEPPSPPIRVAHPIQGAQPYQGAPSYQRAPSYESGVDRQSMALYGPVAGSRSRSRRCRCPRSIPTICAGLFPILRTSRPGTIIIDPQNRYLYLVQGGGRAIRYGVGVGRQGFGWSGVATIRDKQAWPDWYPPKEMIQRQPELRRQLSQLRSGIGVAGGPGNPLGARAMYLWAGGKDTLYRIHGTNEPHTIGQSVSSGCIRMLNQDVIDLYERTPLERQGRRADIARQRGAVDCDRRRRAAPTWRPPRRGKNATPIHDRE